MNTTPIHAIRNWLFLAFVFSLSVAFGRTSLINKDTTLRGNAQNSFFDQLSESEEPLALTLTAEWDSLSAHLWDKGYWPATMQYVDARGAVARWEVGMQARGKFRRRTCAFPPLKLKFKKSELAARGLHADFNKYKLVTNCLDDRKKGDELVLREYLAYRLFEQISGKGYRTRLLLITYLYPDGRIRSTGYGIMLEETDELGARFQADEADIFNPSPDSLDASQEVRVALFQYMIGNADWTYQHMRNLKLYRYEDGSGYFAVPYDFDFSGLVAAPYARPSRELGQRFVGDRVFLGLSQDQGLLRREIGYVLSKKGEMQELIHSFELLPKRSKREMIDYLSAFFETMKEVQQNRQTTVHRQLQTPDAGPDSNPQLRSRLR